MNEANSNINARGCWTQHSSVQPTRANEVSSVANKFNLLKCVECAKAIIEVLEKHGIKGKVIEIRMSEASNIWHEGLKTNISTNGRHVAVEVDGIVYDNITSLPRSAW